MNTFYKQPDTKGHFGQYGGRYIGETLMPAVIELEQAFEKYWGTREFIYELDSLYKNYAGRPTPLFFAKKKPSCSIAIACAHPCPGIL